MADLTIAHCRPSEQSPAIHDLFTRSGEPDFATVFRAVYQVREPLGLRSWVGMLDGRAVLHISLSLERFAGLGAALTAGLPGDLMTDAAHRDFWHPLKLVRRMVADVRATGSADFLLTTYVPAAEGVFKAAGFRPFLAVQRYVMPLQWPYPLLRRLLHGERVRDLSAVPFRDGAEVRLDALASPGSFRPVPGPAFYATRMPRRQYPQGTWLLTGAPDMPTAAVLVSPQEGGELLIADVLWHEAEPALAGVLSAVARWGARHGHRRLSISTVPGSLLAAAARRAGMLVRPGFHRVMLLPVVPLDRIPPAEQWAFTPFVLTGW